jgi:hypothetical protein
VQGLRANGVGSRARAFFEDGVHLVPKPTIDDRLMFTRVRCPFVDSIPNIDPIVEEFIENPFVEEVAISVALAGRDQLPC